jgi:hypothetical protein
MAVLGGLPPGSGPVVSGDSLGDLAAEARAFHLTCSRQRRHRPGHRLA